MNGVCGGGPYSGMASLGRGTEAEDGPREVDGAELFSPQVIFGHVGESPECADALGDVDLPAGFFKHFAVQGGYGVFSGVDASPRKLKFRFRVGLMR